MKTILYNIGHRGAFLLLLGLAFILYGVGLHYIVFPEPTNLILSLNQWVFVWVIGGAIVLAGAFNGADKASFGVAGVISAWWSFHWFWLWAFRHNPSGWSIAFLWAVIVGIILIVASWPESGVRPKIERKRE